MIKQHKTTVKKNLYISLRCFALVNFLNDFAGFHTVEVTGSIPVPPTMKIKGLLVHSNPFFFDDLKVKIGGTIKAAKGLYQKPLSMQFSMKVSDLFCPSAKYADNCLPTSG